MDNVAVVGVGQTVYERRKKGKTFSDLVYEVTVKALEDAGITVVERPDAVFAQTARVLGLS